MGIQLIATLIGNRLRRRLKSEDLFKLKVKNNKTFWMNIVLAIFAALGCFVFFFLNIDYVEARPSEKLLDVISLITPIITAVTLYKGSHQKLSMIFNILVLTILSLLAIRSIYRYPEYPIYPVLIWMIPFIINLKQLGDLNKVEKDIGS